MKKSDHGRMRAEDPLETDRDSDAYAAFAEGNALSGEAEAKASPWPTRCHASCMSPLRLPRSLTGPMSPRWQLERLLELSRQPDVYERLARSLAPSIWELDDIKKGLLCQVTIAAPASTMSTWWRPAADGGDVAAMAMRRSSLA
eukprot:SM008923S23792  [mRNA]  locus=s8923:126:554:- [translate_table: standard]